MPSRGFISLSVGLLALNALHWPRIDAQAEADLFVECEARFAAEPRERQSARCFFELARQGGLWDEAAQKLDGLIGRQPDNPWLHLYLAHVLLISRLSPRAEELYRDAVALLEGLGEAAAGVEARLDLSRCLSRFDRYEEAGEVLEEASRIAGTLGDPTLLAAVRIRQAFQHHYQGEHLDYAYHLLRLVEKDIFPRGPDHLKRSYLDALAFVSHDLGRYDETRECKERLLAMAVEAGDRTAESEARYDIAIHHFSAELPSPSARREARALFEAALAVAQEAGHPSIEGGAHLYLGKLLGGKDGREHLEAGLGIAKELADSDLLSYCQAALAVNLLPQDSRKAKALIEQVMAAAADSPDPWSMIYGWEERWPVHWATLPRPDAVARSLDVLDGIEGLRELQGSGSGRAGLTSQWSNPYFWLSGRLLGGSGPAAQATRNGLERRTVEREDLELAFRVSERLRARTLLEALETAKAAPSLSSEKLLEQLSEVLERKVGIQRRLLDPRMGQTDRVEADAELSTLESRESELRHVMAQSSPSYAALRKPALASLGQLEKSLGANEALLSYQVGLDEDFSGRFAGGAWLLVSTSRGTRSYRLPDRVALEPAVDILLGKSDLDDAAAGLERFYDELLGQALEELPDSVDRLVIIPDGKLHRLPFPLLRSSGHSQHVVSRYQLSVAPSATLWRRWRSLEAPASEVPALALADPLLAPSRSAPAAAAIEAGERQWAFEQGARLERLPYARQEAHAVVRTLGGESRRLLGGEATERFLKENDLRRYGVLHFAAHAVINDEVPERSAILLAPGADDEDGWLQPQDIVELDLEGRVVVLASCESAAGQVLRGEGPMSLARAFFQAGAPVVVASLWPLPDDETARLFKEFYKSLAQGTSVAGALAAAQRKMLRRGAPARAWAGLVALGNGDLVPFPGGLARPGLPVWAYLAVASLAVFLLVLVTGTRGGGRRTPSLVRRGGAEPSP